MIKNIYIVFIAVLILFSCENKESCNNSLHDIELTDIVSSLKSNDHTSEGFLVTLRDGTIIHVFRMDPGIVGSHVSNGGCICKRSSFNNGVSWTDPVVVYNDEYDDRNIRGGLLDDDKIIVFFRRCNIGEQQYESVDLGYILSLDGGKTFSSMRNLNFDIPSEISEVWIDNLTKIGENRYLLPVHGVGYCEMKVFSIENNEILFENENYIFDPSISFDLKIDEPYCCLASGSNIICLFRDEREGGTNYYQSVSSDNGRTFTIPEKTNIIPDFFCPSPLIIYDSSLLQNILVIGTDRRKEALKSKIWIYNNSVEQATANSYSYTLFSTLSRPVPSDYFFYGYPITTKMINGNYLVIITESLNDGINEDADFYQFELRIK